MKKFVPVFNTVSEIDYSIIGNFKLYESIYSGLPFGYIDIADASGDITERFPNIQTGANVALTLLSDDSDIEYELQKFIVLDVEIGNQTTSLKGRIRVWFGHKLFLFKDVSNHAYSPMKRSDLIKKVLQDQTRGYSIKISDENFIKSDDAGETPEYKCNEDDWKFLTKTILPKTCYKQLPVYLYSNAKGDFYLQSFRTLYKKNAKVGFLPTDISDTDEEASSNLDEYMNRHKQNVQLLGISAKIDGKSLLEEVHPSFIVDSCQNGKTISGLKTPLNINTNDGSSLERYIPLDFKVSLSQGANVKLFLNDSLEDNMQKLFADSKNIDRTFNIQATIQFTGKVFLGDVVDLYLKTNHWANGKWIVSKSVIMTDEGNGNFDTLIQQVELIRPSFYGNKHMSTLESTAFLTEIK